MELNPISNAMILGPAESSKVVERTQSLKIFLFGSQARGNAKAQDSDVDLCVVVPDDDEQTHRRAVRAYHHLADMAFPKDIIVRHNSKFEQRSRWINSLEKKISTTGLLLYLYKMTTEEISIVESAVQRLRTELNPLSDLPLWIKGHG